MLDAPTSMASAPGAAGQRRAADGVPVPAAARLRRLERHGPSRRGDAPGHGQGRDHPAARSASPRERGVPDGAPPVAGHHPAGPRRRGPSGDHREHVRQSTSRSSRTCTGGSTRRARARPPSPARRATTSSPSNWQVIAWGGPDVRSRQAVRGGCVRGLPLALVARRDPRARAPGPAALRPGDRRHQSPPERGGVARSCACPGRSAGSNNGSRARPVSGVCAPARRAGVARPAGAREEHRSAAPDRANAAVPQRPCGRRRGADCACAADPWPRPGRTGRHCTQRRQCSCSESSRRSAGSRGTLGSHANAQEAANRAVGAVRRSDRRRAPAVVCAFTRGCIREPA